jgi:tRNA(fMet)-specific endonuclease VapC
MYLLDTNICIALLNNNSKAVAKFNLLFAQCYTSTIVVSELYKGVYCSQQVEKNLETLAQFTQLLTLLIILTMLFPLLLALMVKLLLVVAMTRL